MPQTWLIIGCSSGFGYSLAEFVLSQGHNVIATSRNPSRTPDLVSTIESSSRGKWMALDVTSSAAEISQTIAKAEEAMGGIDVLVNNAGVPVLGAFEDIGEQEARDQLEINYWGPLQIIKAVLPGMRKRTSGTIVNVSSTAGLTGGPISSMYASTKFALEAMSESLSHELSTFKIRILLVEPGAFRSSFLSVSNRTLADISGPYRGTVVEEILQKCHDMDGSQTGDTKKAAIRIFEVVAGTGMGTGKTQYLRMLLGKDCYSTAIGVNKRNKENFEAMREIAESTGHE